MLNNHYLIGHINYSIANFLLFKMIYRSTKLVNSIKKLWPKNVLAIINALLVRLFFCLVDNLAGGHNHPSPLSIPLMRGTVIWRGNE